MTNVEKWIIFRDKLSLLKVFIQSMQFQLLLIPKDMKLNIA